MEIGYNDKQLKKLCLEVKVAEKKLGANCAKKLQARLMDIEAHANVAEIHAGRPHPLRGDRAGQFSLTLTGGKRLVFKPAQESPPTKEDGGIKWSDIKSVIIVFIGDYHE